ncbi:MULTISPECIES: hypothetical protein [Methylosinus]|nr:MULTISPECIES: hypothetical protein [Methylosinus]
MSSASMTIVRGAHRSRFTAISNDLLQNKLGLSCEARSILFDLLSRPEDWRVIIEQLAKANKIGRDRVYKALGELREHGLARLETMRDPETGRIAGSRWIIQEEPDPLPEIQEVDRFLKSPRPDLPDTVNQDAYKRTIEIQNTDSLTKPNAPLPGPQEREEGLSEEEGKASRPSPRDEAWSRFEAAWTFGLGESRGGARKAFDRLSVTDREAAISGAAAFQGAMAGRTHPPHASTYLGERKWTYRPRSPSPPAGASPATAPKGSAGTACERPDGKWWLRDGGPELQRWHEFERKTLGRAATGCIRPAQWPPSLKAKDASGAAEGLRA